MKKVILMFLSAIMIFSMFSLPSYAKTDDESDATVILYDDGSSLTITDIEYNTDSIMRSSSTAKNVSRSYTYKDSSGMIEWEYILYATFEYVYGSTVTCTAASYDYTIYEDSWEFSNGTSSHSGATAYGYGTFKNKFLFVTTKTINVDASISCDVYGNLS